MYCQLKHHHLLLLSSSPDFNKWRLVLHLAEVVLSSVANFNFSVKNITHYAARFCTTCKGEQHREKFYNAISKF